MRPGHRVGVGVIGLGFIGSTHVRAVQAAAREGLPGRLVAVCDRNPERLSGAPAAAGNLADLAGAEPLFDPRELATYGDPAALLEDPAVDLVCICTRTDSHVGLSLAALAAGKHVLVEKPVGLTAEEVARLAGAAAASDRLCIPAMCMRFWPGWDWLHARVRDGRFGDTLSATFRRLGSRPTWAPGFYDQDALSGGALVDLHVHDSDFVRWCFGEPAAVASTGSLDHLTTLYRYPGGPPHVVAEGGWDQSEGFGFRMRYLVTFEEATCDFDLDRDPPLRLVRSGAARALTLDPGTGHAAEIRHVLLLASGRLSRPRVTMSDALATARLLDAERQSLIEGREVAFSA